MGRLFRHGRVGARLIAELDVIRQRDPSVGSRLEALLHPSVVALRTHRVAHWLYRRGRRIPARLLAMLARAWTGVEIHPGARIGHNVFIDHGAAVVIGETASVGDDVTIFQQVTLGSVGWWHDQSREPGSPRHPSIGDRVVLGAGATVLGPVHVGADSVIGALALVIRDVPTGTRVTAPLGATARRGASSPPDVSPSADATVARSAPGPLPGRTPAAWRQRPVRPGRLARSSERRVAVGAGHPGDSATGGTALSAIGESTPFPVW